MMAPVSGARERNIWLPSQGRYLSRLKLATLRNFARDLFVDKRSAPIDQDRATAVLRQLWQSGNLGREPGPSHAYRHLLALRLLGLITPHGKRDGYALTRLGGQILDIGGSRDTLNRDEQELLARAFFFPPRELPSPLLAFAALFCPSPADPEAFRDQGQSVAIKRHSMAKLEVTTGKGTVWIEREDAVDHVLSGCRELFLEAGLVGEVLPDRAAKLWQRTLFPVHHLDESHLHAAVVDVAVHLRRMLEHTTRVSIPTLGAELRPLMKLSRADFEEVLQRISREYAGEFYFDRLSSILILGREHAYVQIGGYWRSTIVRH